MKLNRKRHHPYYVVAPSYTRLSAGTRVIHKLCDALRQRGEEAWIITNLTNPELDTPTLNDATISEHRTAKLTPIAVYPEIVGKNPLNCDVVARYILNVPGLLGDYPCFHNDDLIFLWNENLVKHVSRSDGILFMPEINTEIFNNNENCDTRVRSERCIYFGRYQAGRELFPDLLSTHTEITYSWPESREDLARLLRRSQYLICFEHTSLSTEAQLCGCPVVHWDSPFLETGKEWTKGLNRSIELSALEREYARLEGFTREWKNHESTFWSQLDAFITKTQDAATRWSSKQQFNNPRKTISKITDNTKNKNADDLLKSIVDSQRNISSTQKIIAHHILYSQQEPRKVLVIIFQEYYDQIAFSTTVESVRRSSIPNAFVQIAVASRLKPQVSYDIDHIDISDCKSIIQDIRNFASARSINWIIPISAGDEFLEPGFLALLNEIQRIDVVSNIIADYIISNDDESLEYVAHPDFTIDYFILNPNIALRCWIHNTNTLVSSDSDQVETIEEFNFSIVQRTLDRAQICVGHMPHMIKRSKNSISLISQTIHDSIQQHTVTSLGINCKVLQDSTEISRIKCHKSSPHPEKVSIILSAFNDHKLLQMCIERILTTTSNIDFHIHIVDRGSNDPVCVAWLDGMSKDEIPLVSVHRPIHGLSEAGTMRWVRPFVSGSHILFLRSNVLPLHPDWLENLLNHTRRPNVAWVAPKVVNKNGEIVSAGRILGLNGVCSSPFIGARPDDPGYRKRLLLDQNYSAVGHEACMVRIDIFDQIIECSDYFDDHQLALVEYSLRALTLDYSNVWTPFSRMVQVDATSVDEATQLESRIKRTLEEDRIYASWLTLIANDPAYNRNFSLRERGFQIEGTPGLSGDTKPWLQVPRVLAFNADEWGCGHYRVIQPFRAMEEQGLLKGAVVGSPLYPAEVERVDPEVIVLQRQVVDVQLDTLRRLRQFSTAFKVYELDDYILNLPLENHHRHQLPREIRKRLMKGLSQVDRFVVSTDALAEAFKGFHPDIRVQKLYLPNPWWKAVSPRQIKGGKPRVGWAGGTAHAGDLALIADVVKDLADEVDWVFLGTMPKGAEAHIAEYHEGVEIRHYPEKLASLGLDLALAPLEDNLFNRCKSNLKFLEYGACGYPVIASDIECYRGSGLPVTLVKNRYRDWLEAIRSHLADLDASRRQARQLREQVLASWMLDGPNLEHWLQAWTVK